MQDSHISTYPFPHCTNSKHSLLSIFPCSCFSINQRSAGCPERRFLTGRRVGWASGRLINHSYSATYFMFASLRPSYFSFAKSLSRNSDTSSIHHCLLNPVSSARQGRSGSSAGQKQAVTYPPPLSMAFSYLPFQYP